MRVPPRRSPEGASDASTSNDATSARVVAASRSLAQMAILAGMPPVGVTEDATDLDGLPADVETVGTPAKPSLEKIVALEPTLVLITAEVPTQKELESSLDSAGIAWRDVDVNNLITQPTCRTHRDERPRRPLPGKRHRRL